MDFRANSGIWGTMFGVPCIVADNFLKLATGEQIKVLLYILRCSGKDCTDGEIALNTGITPQAASDAILFWQQVNVLTADAHNASPAQSQIISPPPTQPREAAPPVEKAVNAPRKKTTLSGTEIAGLMKDSSDISELLKTAEGVFGIINHTQQNSLIWMYTYLGLKKEVIITLISYCASIGKTNSAYIEKIACAWSENEINTLNAAQEEVSRMSASREYTAQVMRAFEMNRRPTAKQADFIAQWKKNGFTIELMHYAYEKTIEQIDRLSFEYINKILLSWRDSGFVSVQDVKNAESAYKKNKKSSAAKQEDDFDVDKYKIFINDF